MIDSLQPVQSNGSAARVAAAAIVVSLLGGLALLSITIAISAGPGRSGPDKTIPTLPTTSPGAVTTDGTGPESSPETSGVPATSEAPQTTVVVDTGIALPAGAPIYQMLATASPLFRSTTDVAGALGQFALVPDGIPSPVDSTIQTFSVHYYGIDSYFRADATFASSATPDDVAIFYETAMTASGFVLTGDDVQSDELTRRLEFDNPDSEYDAASVEVLIDGDVDGVITLTIVDYADPIVLAAYNGWALGMPTIADGTPVEASLSATRNPEVVLNVSTRYEYDDRSADELIIQIREAIAGGAGSGFRIDEENDDGTSTISMTHPVINFPVATIGGDDDESTSMVLAGSLTL